jgi:ADP-ribose pyrophosphatase YjhB (NUDIX family)
METQLNPWKVLNSSLKYDNNWIKVTEYDVINPSGGKGIYGKVHFKNIAIGIVAIDENMNIYLVGQYRFTIDQYSWEIPEGGCIIGTDPLESAKRELLEETGLKANDWTLLMNMHISNCVSDEYSYTYIARGLEQHTPMPEETEQLITMKVSLEEALQMIEKGEITDSMSVAALQKVKLMQLQGKL